ncbi:MAG: hypothetical protein KJN90_04210 [Gammaproteobacteria bacterium]|nr:hypothetical protein [Gammaproteobacteria bacterium]
MNILETVKNNFSQRPWWMNALLLFCAYMTFIYVPWDLLSKPVSEAQEVWFGVLLTGWAAKATEPLHWLIYGAGTMGFWQMRSWMHPWASLYTAQVAVGMFVWSVLDERGQGALGGLLTAIPFVVLAVLLWRSRHRFGGGQ